MLFHSVSFLLFFLLTAIAHRVLPRRFRWAWLLLASAAFYASFLPGYLAVLAAATLLSYLAGIGIERSSGGTRRALFVAAVGANLLLLVFFKYSPFFDACAASLARVLDLRYPEGALRLVLPLGFSFFVFTATSYLLEIGKGKIRAERHPGFLALHFLFFAKLPQGPIERPQNLLPQIREARSSTPDEIASGFRRMLLGAFKKLVVADRLAVYVNAVYGNEPMHNGSSLLLATLFYSFQIYADFSGYTDIALGSAEVLGFRLTPNFKRPYFATSISDFWNRWHISLSSWLRDYLFLPLAYFFANRARKPRYLGIRSDKWVYLFAVMITFVLCGAWHGEGWNFIVWGGLFGLYLAVSNGTRKIRRGASRRSGLARRPRLHAALRILFTFSLVTVAWVFFRGGSLGTIGSILKKIAGGEGRPFLDSPSTMIYSFFGIAAILAIDAKDEFFGGRLPVFTHRSAFVRLGASAALLLGILLFGVLDGGQFIYFQF